MSPRTITMTDSLYAYYTGVSVREPAILARLREETAALGTAAGMQIGPDQGQFMALLVDLLGVRSLLEIGTFTGYSTLACALALPRDGRIVACDVSEDWTSIARRYWIEAGVMDRIDLRLGPAAETLEALIADGRADGFDMAFIDADKTGYDRYYELSLKLVRPGGLILIDNVLWNGSVADPGVTDPNTEALRRLNRKLHDDDRIRLSMVPIGDGLTLAMRRR